ncbi:MAG: hypothetical protein GXO86_09120 [Chlorobi bacterium]|nr:hypothetical protein [Chlorobiota bacterium]
MATQNEAKLKTLLNNMKPGTVILASWLKKLGISGDLQKHYRKSGWLESIGRGAFKKPGEKIKWEGALYALQYQAKLNIHAGAITALSMQGLSHYFRLGTENVFLFAPRKINLPKWFLNNKWENPIRFYQTDFLPANLGLADYEEKNFTIKISSPERAILECLYLSPKVFDLVECYHLTEGLVNLKPKLVQQLLQQSKSVKTKRLFLFFSEKANHEWLRFIDLSSIDFGSGNRRITEKGVYLSKYQLSVPKELTEL